MQKNMVLKPLLLIMVAFVLSASAYTQKLPSYNLDGYLYPGDFKILLMFRINEKNNSLYTKLYVPEQGGFGLEADQTYIDGDSIFIKFERMQISYSAYIDVENKQLVGTYIQGMNNFELILDFIDDEEATSFERPQKPTEPFPYVIKEHTIYDQDNNINLVGTLFLPDTLDNYKLAIITTGGGAPNREYMFGGHNVFLIIADHLARNGIASFIYDERGTGESNGNFEENTTRTYMMDALFILSYFKSHKNINSEKIGFLGHSEGALVAMKAAAINRNDVAFVVSLAGPGVPIVEMMKRQAADIYRLSDDDEEKIEILIQCRQDMFDAVTNLKPDQNLRRILNSIAKEYAQHFSEEDVERYGLNKVGAHQFFTQVRSPWLSYFLKIKPSAYIERIRCPVLALAGDLDIQIHAESNIKAIEKALKNGECPYYETKIYQGLNHIFQPAEIGSLKEYMLIQKSISEDVLKKVTKFITNLESFKKH